MDADGIAERSRRIREAVAEAAVEVTSEDHAVTVVVGPGGAVRDLQLSPRAFHLGGAALGELVVRTIREANTRMGQELAATLAEIMGDRTALARPFAPLPTPAQLRAELDGGAR
ncbi:YbaB/EbfC family nucleoid-associated protein [Micromonospora sp. NPDC049559]|uniref:YbaB/EbfC family nucleoid-associated protein n=1 Tax=Micromonospora sp. NPDC049559 TaxID=3155923 RepID=UPI0034292116